MASLTAFNCFEYDLGRGIHDFTSHTFKIYLTNEAPVPTDTAYGNPADLATGGGYTAGGEALDVTWSQTDGVASLVANANLQWTATGGFGPFRYAVMYNDTAASNNLVAWADNGSPITIAAGAPFDLNFSGTLLSLDA